MNYTLHYEVYGTGEKTMLAFHGFGQDCKLFQHYTNVFPDYKIYSFDLFFHGKSTWENEEEIMETDEFLYIFRLFFEKKPLQNISILAFSLGAKLACSLALAFPERIEKLILLAPDGFRENIWYTLATRVPATRGLFRWLMQPDNSTIINVIEMLSMFGFYNKVEKKFLRTTVETASKRELVFRTWMLFSKIRFSPKELAYDINRIGYEIEIYSGGIDSLIPPKNVLGLLKTVKRASFYILPCSHQALPDAVLRKLSSKK